MVRFRAVGLHHPDGDRAALSGLTFDLPGGSFHWLLGPSGAGKSSLLRLLALAARPTAGRAEVLGLVAGEAGRAALTRARRRIGALHQEPRLLAHMTVFDNVALPLRLAGRHGPAVEADAHEMLRWVGLGERAGARPAALSGGERQRVALARAVVVRPALLLADEPTGALDEPQARRVLALLRELHRLGTTVVVATHAEGLVAEHPAPSLRLLEGRLEASA